MDRPVPPGLIEKDGRYILLLVASFVWILQLCAAVCVVYTNLIDLIIYVQQCVMYTNLIDFIIYVQQCVMYTNLIDYNLCAAVCDVH